MKYWITTDTHFYHENMVNLCHRPVDFHNIIVNNWLNQVNKEDLVIHLGDVSFSNDLVVDRLPGRKILIKGNHDKKSYSYYMSHGFDFCCETFTLNYAGLDIVFSHKPLIFHEHDVNIHGHLHDCAKIDSVCNHWPVALEFNKYTLEDLNTIAQKIVKKKQEAEKSA